MRHRLLLRIGAIPDAGYDLGGHRGVMLRRGKNSVMKPKINQQIADDIRRRFRAGEPGKIIAHSLGITKSNVSMIVNNKIWKEHDRTEQTSHNVVRVSQ